MASNPGRSSLARLVILAMKIWVEILVVGQRQEKIKPQIDVFLPEALPVPCLWTCSS